MCAALNTSRRDRRLISWNSGFNVHVIFSFVFNDLCCIQVLSPYISLKTVPKLCLNCAGHTLSRKRNCATEGGPLGPLGTVSRTASGTGENSESVPRIFRHTLDGLISRLVSSSRPIIDTTNKGQVGQTVDTLPGAFRAAHVGVIHDGADG